MSMISVIVTTYNRPDALRACLNALAEQNDPDFEILIADDGSGESTRDCVLAFRAANPSMAVAVKHVYQEDLGFRAGAIRNKAVARARGDYLVFMDGDCVVFPDFIGMHRKLAQPGYFVPGNRILLSRAYTAEVLDQGIPLHRKSIFFFFRLFLRHKINHIGSLIRMPLGYLRILDKTGWKKAKTCNLGLWKNDFRAVNGFDEAFEGWGYEDSDLVIRLIHSGGRRKSGRHAVPVLHLWHAENDRSRHDRNLQRFLQRLDDKRLIRAEKGFDHYVDPQDLSEVLD